MKQFLELPALQGLGVVVGLILAVSNDSLWGRGLVIAIVLLSLGSLYRMHASVWFNGLSRPRVLLLGLIFGLGSATAIGFMLINWLRPSPTQESAAVSPIGADITLRPHWAFAYGGEQATPPKVGRADLKLERDDANRPYYRFIYTLPDDSTYGYAGLAFTFRAAQDLTPYAYIEARVGLDPETSGCGIYLKDDDDEQEPPVILNLDQTYGPDVRVTIDGAIKTVRIPLRTYYPKVNLGQVGEIGYSASSEFAKGGGSCLVYDTLLLTEAEAAVR